MEDDKLVETEKVCWNCGACLSNNSAREIEPSREQNSNKKSINDFIIKEIPSVLFPNDAYIFKVSLAKDKKSVHFISREQDSTYLTIFNFENVDLLESNIEDSSKWTTQKLQHSSDSNPIRFSSGNYLVDENGISINGSAAKVGDLDYGSHNWEIKGSSSINNMISSLLEVDDKLYIGLHSNPSFFQPTGGVVIFNPRQKLGRKITAPKGVWGNRSIVGLTADKDNKVWAVTKNALIKVGPNTEHEIEIDTNSSVKIIGAEWVGDYLILANRNGISIWIEKKLKQCGS
jgi:hypothetical protein